MLAQNLNAIQSGAGIKAPSDVGGVIGNILPYAFYLSGFLLLVYMIMGGFSIMTSRGDPKAITAGQAKITNAVIGFVIILVSAGVVVLLGRLLKIDVFSSLFS